MATAVGGEFLAVIVALELEEFDLQVSGGPEERAVQAFSSNRANQSFDERMRERLGMDLIIGLFPPAASTLRRRSGRAPA